jgi:hypothetical protein
MAVRVLSIPAASGWLTAISTGIRGDARGITGKWVKKRRHDVPNIAFA